MVCCYIEFRKIVLDNFVGSQEICESLFYVATDPIILFKKLDTYVKDLICHQPDTRLSANDHGVGDRNRLWISVIRSFQAHKSY